jgi:hypothetical protein
VAANLNGHAAETPKSSPAAAQKPWTTFKVPILLAVSDQLHPQQGIGIVRSGLAGEERQILVTLNKLDMLTGKALARADTTTIKFYVALLVTEWIHYWSQTHEGRLIRTAMRKAAGISPDFRLWWTGFASAVARTPLFDKVAQVPIYGPAGQLLPSTELFPLDNVTLRRESQIRSWNPGVVENPAFSGGT